MKYYLAYGSNMNLEQMARRCPHAKIIGTTELQNYRLLFRGARDSAVATIEPCDGMSVPVLLWKITPADEKALDRYEAFPHLYRKETLNVELNGRIISAMAYIMNGGRSIAPPGFVYYSVILSGYRASKLDPRPLTDAVSWSIRNMHD